MAAHLGMTRSEPRNVPIACHNTPIAVSPVRVASVPSGHVYVRHLAPPEPDEPPLETPIATVMRLPDPDPDDPRRPAGARWWPPVALQAEWVDANAERFDVFHVHFGFDAVDPEDLRALVRALRRQHKPLVYTVHDLRNPHHADPAAHDAQLDVLVPAADALITLTEGAADVIHRRWGRRARVLPHPHVVDLDTMERLRSRPVRPPGELRIGVHVKSLRPSMDPLPVLRVLEREATASPGIVLQVNGHRDVLLPGGARYDPVLATTLHGWAGQGRVDLRVHDFLSDAALWEYLSALDVSVLPYRFGTHSGWLEACRDLGVHVLAPTCGFYAEQAPVTSYRHDESGLDEESLARAVHKARDLVDEGLVVSPVATAVRRAQRTTIAKGHAELYRALL